MDINQTLIVNADDFGLTEAINQGVAIAYQDGILTSTTVMVRARWAYQAKELLEQCPQLGIGLHFTTEAWKYSDTPWTGVYDDVPETAEAVAQELHAQYTRFEELVGQPPTHIDSHHHVHTQEPARQVVLDYANHRHIPVRMTKSPATLVSSFFGDTDLDAISPTVLVSLLHSFEENITTELMCHPSVGETKESSYNEERIIELRTLCSPLVREAVDNIGIQLISYADITL